MNLKCKSEYWNSSCHHTGNHHIQHSGALISLPFVLNMMICVTIYAFTNWISYLYFVSAPLVEIIAFTIKAKNFQMKTQMTQKG